MNILVSINTAYMQYLYIMLLSLYETNQDEDICVYVLYRDLSEDAKETLTKLTYSYGKQMQFIYINDQWMSIFECMPLSNGYHIEVYFRLAMFDLLPKEVDRILSLDADVLVRQSLKRLYDTPFDGFYLMASQDMLMPEIWEDERRKIFNRNNGDYRYFNAGVVLWNVFAMRKQYGAEDFVVSSHQLGEWMYLQEQDILNYLLYDHVQYIDGRKYNYQIGNIIHQENEDVDTAAILHYTPCHPWQIGEKCEVYQLWWDYAKRSPFYSAFLEKQMVRLEDAWMSEHVLRRIYELFFELRGTGQMCDFLCRRKEKLLLYGLGHFAECFMSAFHEDDIEKYIAGYVDRDKEKNIFLGHLVRHDFTWCDPKEKYIIIVTPVGKVRQIMHSLKTQIPTNVRVIHLSELLDCLWAARGANPLENMRW